jgi:hypothetical protein
MSRAFLRVVSKKRFALFHQDHAFIVCEPSMARIRARSSKRLSKKFVLRQKFVQQHSGDWTMTGKVPVARAKGQPPLPGTKSEG